MESFSWGRDYDIQFHQSVKLSGGFYWNREKNTVRLRELLKATYQLK